MADENNLKTPRARWVTWCLITLLTGYTAATLADGAPSGKGWYRDETGMGFCNGVGGRTQGAIILSGDGIATFIGHSKCNDETDWSPWSVAGSNLPPSTTVSRYAQSGNRIEIVQFDKRMASRDVYEGVIDNGALTLYRCVDYSNKAEPGDFRDFSPGSGFNPPKGHLPCDAEPRSYRWTNDLSRQFSSSHSQPPATASTPNNLIPRFCSDGVTPIPKNGNCPAIVFPSKAEREKEAAAQRAAQKAEREKAEREKAERERAERERAERERAEWERAERERAERERAERERAEAMAPAKPMWSLSSLGSEQLTEEKQEVFELGTLEQFLKPALSNSAAVLKGTAQALANEVSKETLI